MFELNQLKQFITVADCQNISKAAELLNITQPALSRSIQNLETELGVSLFNRSKNKIVLNETGFLALEKARELVSRSEEFQKNVNAHYWKNHCIAIGTCAPSPALGILKEALENEFSGMKYTEETVESKMLEKNLLNGNYQLAIFSNYIDDERLVQLPIFKENLYAVLPKEHRFAGRKEGIYIKELNGESVIPFPLKGYWNDLIERELPDSQKIYQATIQGFEAIVKASSIVSFSSLIFNEKDNKHVYLPILDEDAHLSYHLACLKRDKEIFKKLFDYVKKNAANFHITHF
ncbi:MAG: LysR family transcriptional regulator [Treponema sp.]|nr:LysR family transcriptional regulator [Treponema sp.]